MKYATIKNGKVVGVSYLSGEVNKPDMLLIDDDTDVEAGYLYDGSSFIAPTPATHRTNLTRLEFRNLFSLAEKQALYEAAKTSVDVQIYIDDLNAAQYVETTDQATSEGLNALVSAGILTQSRCDEILLGLQVN